MNERGSSCVQRVSEGACSLHVCQIVLSSNFAGAERQVLDMALALAEHGTKVSLIVNKQLTIPPYMSHQNLTIYQLALLSRHDPIARLKLRRLLIQINPTILHLHLRRAVTMVKALFSDNKFTFGFKLGGGVLSQIPVVCSLHNKANMAQYAGVDWYFTPTQSLLDHVQIYFQGTERSQTNLFPASLLPNFSRLPALLTEPKVRPSPRFFSYGRLVKKKGFSVLLQAWSKVVARHPQLTLTLAGEGPEREALQQSISELYLVNSVNMLPWVENISDFIDNHDIFILPSLDEPFGLVVIEAMARGKIVIASDCDGPVEILGTDSPFLFASGDAHDLATKVNYVLANIEHGQNWIASNIERFATQYSANVVVPQLLDKYYQLGSGKTVQQNR